MAIEVVLPRLNSYLSLCINAANKDLSATSASPFHMEQVLVSMFHFPAVKTDFYNPLFPVFYPKQRICFCSANITFHHVLFTVLHQLDQKIIYPHYDFKHLTEKYFEIGMKLNDFSIQLVKYCIYLGRDQNFC